MAKAYELIFEALKGRYFTKVLENYTQVVQPVEKARTQEELAGSRTAIANWFSIRDGLWKLSRGNPMNLSCFMDMFEIPEAELPFDPEIMELRTKESKLVTSLRGNMVPMGGGDDDIFMSQPDNYDNL